MEEGEPGPELTTVELHLSRVARLGLAGRAAFYLLLVGLTIRLALLGQTATSGSGTGQPDASGALDAVDLSIVGQAAIAAVGAGFVLFGVARLVGAARDRSVAWHRRAMTVLQGLFYLALAYIPVAFLAGARQTGSEGDQERTVASVLSRPAGPELLAAAGTIAIVVCAQQVRGAVTRQFREGLDLATAPPTVRRVCEIAGVVGIVARAGVFLPVGVFLIAAAVRSDPRSAYGTDAELVHLAGTPWGAGALVIVAAGLATFAVFSVLETRYRVVVSAR